MNNNYDVIFNKDNFTNINEFISWAFSNKDIILNNNFKIKSEINDIKEENVNNFISFLKYYTKVKKSCDNKNETYNITLRKLSNNKELKEALDEFVRMNEGGKFLRATLVALGYHSVSNYDDKYLDLALALEIFQTSILIHDDIIDKAKTRRGKDTIPESYIKKNKTINSANFNEKRDDYAKGMALCLGDLGFYLAEEIMIKAYKKEEILSNILSYYHNVAIKTCLGEMIDIELPFKEEFYQNTNNLEEKIMEIYKLKTAWYSVIGPFCLGMILGKAKEEDIKEMEKLLLNIGIAFQIKDDILGVYGNDKYIGKSTNSDIEEYKQTILYSYTINTNYKDELLKYYGKSNLTEEEIAKVKEIFEKSKAKNYAENLMNKLFESSLNKLNNINFIKKEFKEILIGFIIYLENRMR
ncbi:MAG: polyprenyl synthetase family protein [Bacilli bacterium]|nr:polyprenyl synthetase family protein [Bacilli bacterium]